MPVCALIFVWVVLRLFPGRRISHIGFNPTTGAGQSACLSGFTGLQATDLDTTLSSSSMSVTTGTRLIRVFRGRYGVEHWWWYEVSVTFAHTTYKNSFSSVNVYVCVGGGGLRGKVSERDIDRQRKGN